MAEARVEHMTSGGGRDKCLRKRTKNLENFRHWKFQLSKMGSKWVSITPRSLLSRTKWFLVDRPNQESSCDGGHPRTLLWLHDQF